jgi:surface polysaccharide O-acyltransferase-like enzyme
MQKTPSCNAMNFSCIHWIPVFVVFIGINNTHNSVHHERHILQEKLLKSIKMT